MAAGESLDEVNEGLGFNLNEAQLVQARAKYEAGGCHWEALVDGRYGHAQKVHSGIREWLYRRKERAEEVRAPELAREIKEKLPWLELWVHDLEAESLEQGDERTVYGMEMFRNMCQMQYALKDGDFTFEVNKRLKGEEKLEIGGTVWEILHIPGHSPGSIALYHRKKKVLIPGDVVYADYAIGRFDLHEADASALKQSLKRLSDLEVEILFFADKPIGITLPNFVDLAVAKADPWVKGDSASSDSKPVTLETAYVLRVPPFIGEGDKITVDTRSGEYVTRVKE